MNIEHIRALLRAYPDTEVVFLDIDDTVMDQQHRIINEELLAASLRGKIVCFATDKQSGNTLPGPLEQFVKKYHLIHCPELFISGAVKNMLFADLSIDIRMQNIINLFKVIDFTDDAFNDAVTQVISKMCGGDLSKLSSDKENIYQEVANIYKSVMRQAVNADKIDQIPRFFHLLQQLTHELKLERHWPELANDMFGRLVDSYEGLIKANKLAQANALLGIIYGLTQGQGVIYDDSIALKRRIPQYPEAIQVSWSSGQLSEEGATQLRDYHPGLENASKIVKLSLGAMVTALDQGKDVTHDIQRLLAWYEQQAIANATSSERQMHALSYINSQLPVYRLLQQLSQSQPKLIPLVQDFIAMTVHHIRESYTIRTNESVHMDTEALRQLYIAFDKSNKQLLNFGQIVLENVSIYLPPEARQSLSFAREIIAEGVPPITVSATPADLDGGRVACTFTYKAHDDAAELSYTREFESAKSLYEFFAADKGLLFLYLMLQLRALPKSSLQPGQGLYQTSAGVASSSPASSSSSTTSTSVNDVAPTDRFVTCTMSFADDKPWYVEQARALGLFAFQADTKDAMQLTPRSLGFLRKDLERAVKAASAASSSSGPSVSGQDADIQRSMTEVEKHWPQYMAQVLKPLERLIQERDYKRAIAYIDTQLVPRIKQYPNDFYLLLLGRPHVAEVIHTNMTKLVAHRKHILDLARSGKAEELNIAGTLSKERYQVEPYKQLGITRSTAKVTLPRPVHAIIHGLDAIASQDFSHMASLMQALDQAIRDARTDVSKQYFQHIKIDVEMLARLNELRYTRDSIVGHPSHAQASSSTGAGGVTEPIIGGTRSKAHSMAELIEVFNHSLHKQMAMMRQTEVTPLAVANTLITKRIYPLFADMVDSLARAQGVSSSAMFAKKAYESLDFVLLAVSGLSLEQLAADPHAQQLLLTQRLFKGALEHNAAIKAAHDAQGQLSVSPSAASVEMSASIPSLPSLASAESSNSLSSSSEDESVSDEPLHLSDNGASSSSDSELLTAGARLQRLQEVRREIAEVRAARQKGPGSSTPHS